MDLDDESDHTMSDESAQSLGALSNKAHVEKYTSAHQPDTLCRIFNRGIARKFLLFIQ